MTDRFLLIVNGGVRWFVVGGPVPQEMPDLYKNVVESYESRKMRIEYQKFPISEERTFALLTIKANSLVDRVNKGEISPDKIEEEMEKKKDHKKR